MESYEKLRQKMLSLILEETGITASDAEFTYLQQDKDINALLTNIIVRVAARKATPATDTANASAAIEALPEMVNSPAVTDDSPLEAFAPELPGVKLEKEPDCTSSASQATEDELKPLTQDKILVTVHPVAFEPSAQQNAAYASEALEAPTDEQTEQVMPPLPLEQSVHSVVTEPVVKPLKPGQVPTGTPTPMNNAHPAIQPVVRINIANARSGLPFNSKVEITLDDGIAAEIHEICFAKDIGITFDRASCSLSGMATESGDFEIAVIWSSATTPANSTKVLFIVNPDPRSLWRIVEPPADSRYFKQHIKHQLIREPGVNIVAASRRGRSHEHAGTFRDDDFYIASNTDTGWNIMLVADGAGSAKNSREGSRIVTQTVGHYLTNQLRGGKGQELKERILSWTPDDQRVLWEVFNHQFRQAAIMAVNNIRNESIQSEESVKSYSTTLLVTVSFRAGVELFAASFWMGDGVIAAYGPVGKVRVLGTPDSGEYAGQTRFLDVDAIQDPNFSKRISIGKWTEISHLVLMTDGVSDPRFETDNGLQNPQKWDDLISELEPCLSEQSQPAEQLAEWLNFFSPGNHDDRTIVVSW